MAIPKVVVRAPYSYDADEVSLETGVEFDHSTDRAQQHFAKEVDINELVKRFGITGDLPVSKELAEYGDFSEVVDYKTAMDQLRRGEQAFAELPARVRERFDNEPGKFWEFLHSDGIDEAVELGLLDPRVLPPVVQDSPGGAGSAAPTPE